MTSVVSRIVELCVFRFVADRPEYLLLRRAGDVRLYPGLWQFVTGRIEGTEKAWEASLRELREETGLRPERFWAVPCIGSFYDPADDTVNLMPFFAAQVSAAATPALSHEHREFAWLSYRDAFHRLVWPGQRRGLDVVHQEVIAGTQAGRLTVLAVP